MVPDHCTRRVDTTCMRVRTRSLTVKSQTDKLGRTSLLMASTAEEKANISTPPDQPRASSCINDNQCVEMLQTRLLAGSSPQTLNNVSPLNVKPLVVSNVHTAPGHSKKKEISPGSAGCHYTNYTLKSVKSVLCHSIVLCSTCNKCQKCCLKSACRGQTSKLLAKLAGSGCRSENSSNPEGGLHPSFSDPAKSHKVSHSHKLLCQSPQEQLPDRGITSTCRQKCC